MTTERIYTTLPAVIVAGDSVSWQLSHHSYPALEGWVLSYAFVSTGKQIQVISNGIDGNSHLFSVSSGITSSWPAGEYKYQVYATKDGERHTVADGRLIVEVDFFTAIDGIDARTPAERTLDSLQATYDKAAARIAAAKSSGIASITDKTLAELREQIQRQKLIVAAERGKARKTIYPRFNNN